MKIPNIPEVKLVANWYGLSTKGRLISWLKLMNPNAPICYEEDGEMKHIRVCKLLQLMGAN